MGVNAPNVKVNVSEGQAQRLLEQEQVEVEKPQQLRVEVQQQIHQLENIEDEEELMQLAKYISDNKSDAQQDLERFETQNKQQLVHANQ